MNYNGKRVLPVCVRYNDDAEFVAKMEVALEKKEGFCPCRLARVPENKCICAEFRNQIADPKFEGYCHCRLFYKTPDPNETDIAGIKRELEKGNRVILQVRHAERTKIDLNDPTFGEALGITEEGQRASEKLGEMLREYAAATQFLSSPLTRTTMTAACIAKGMGLDGTAIPTAPFLGSKTPYFADAHAVFELFRDGSFFAKTFEYFARGTQTGLADLQTATEELERDCLAAFDPAARLGIFTTHDLYIAAFLVGTKTIPRFTVSSWTRFLDAAAIVIEPSGARRYYLVRTGLSTEIKGVE